MTAGSQMNANNLHEPAAGFDFSNYLRNQNLLQTDGAAPKLKAKKTGTTIVGTVYAGGVVLGADTRATNDTEVAERNCEKIHYIAPNMYCCGAGTAADTENTTALISRQLELLRMDTARPSRLVTAVTLLKRMLFRYQGHVSAALVLGGCDLQGPHIYQIYPHGSTAKLPYTSMGSGSLAAMAVLESSWQENMTEDMAVQLVQRAIGAGIFNDLGSGSNCDICIIKTDGTVDYRRNAVKPNELAPLRAQVQRSGRLNMRPGLTPIIKSEFKPHPVVAAGGETAMEVE
ncbi:20S proteasome subunit beta 2 [Fistulifera solaris]|jgi:20S proteasome subunit beta 2|uniref:20S proteasome subunit beta 2 n=1 Tax=Fistulifera solaris TaxID=1519565 RepID=A0A1Z5JK86_FISSO|nr:20S proteasome subunit beta 2 [Fistulifera solaris]|eukprot:GAX14208.1 20S proteasome subunit beta 2 [Fistulifera solaris]